MFNKKKTFFFKLRTPNKLNGSPKQDYVILQKILYKTEEAIEHSLYINETISLDTLILIEFFFSPLVSFTLGLIHLQYDSTCIIEVKYRFLNTFLRLRRFT